MNVSTSNPSSLDAGPTLLALATAAAMRTSVPPARIGRTHRPCHAIDHDGTLRIRRWEGINNPHPVLLINYTPEIDDPEFLARARGVGIPVRPATSGEWPYGANIDARSRLALVEWAETEGLKLYDGRTQCLHWLVKARCTDPFCREHSGVRRWLDHMTLWTKDGKPHTVIGQPYGVSDEALAEIDEVSARYGCEAMVLGTGWYGHGTTFVRLSRGTELSGGAR